MSTSVVDNPVITSTDELAAMSIARLTEGRPNFARRKFPVLAQLWMCLTCETVRMWAWGKPPAQALADPLLGCEKCKQPTRHGFYRVA